MESIKSVYLAYPERGIQVVVRDWRQYWFAERFASMYAKKLSWERDSDRARRGQNVVWEDARPVIASWGKVGDLIPVGWAD